MDNKKKIKKVKGYKIDFANNTLIMNYTFAAAVQNWGSGEYELYKEIMSDFPMLKVIVKSGRNTKTPRYNKRLTYENMEKYIRTFANAEELLKQFELVKAKSAPMVSPYKYVSEWFVAQFPNYKDVPVYENNGTVIQLVAEPNADLYSKSKKVA